MVHLCTCTGGSTSTIKSSKRRSGTLSCKNCGGKPAIDGKKSSNCLLNTLTSLIHSDFKVSKGCRSSSRRPRRSNTVNLLDSEELLTKDLKGLEMPVSESEKLGVSVLGCHFSEKAEHIPIKKRRFLFRASSPPCNNPNPPLEAVGPKASSYGLQLNQNANCLPATSETVTGTCERSNKDDKTDVKKLVKDDDFSGISILAAAACSNSLGAETDPKTVEVNENSVKIEVLEESKLNNSSLESGISNMNQEPSIQKDVRFSWDLNTVMDAWEEPFVSDAAEEKATLFEEKKKDCTKDNYQDCKNNLKPDGVGENHEFNSCQHNKTLTVENTTRDLFSKWAKFNDSSETVDTKLSMDCSVPPGFDHFLNLRVSKENDKQDSSSLTTANFLENGPHQKTVTSEKVENESMMKMDNKDSKIKEETQMIFGANPVGPTSMVVEEQEKEKEKAAELQLENGFDYNYDNSQSDNRVEIGYDSQYEDGELRESSWKEYELNNEENEYDLENHNENDDYNPDYVDANETNEEENPSGIITVPEITKEADLNVKLPEKIQTSEEVLSGSVQPNSGKQDIVQNAYEWKMNVSGWDVLPENQRISLNKTRNNLTARKFSYSQQKDGEDVEGSRFYKKDSQSRPSTHDMFLNRSRLRMQGCSSSKGGDGLTSRPERESGGIRSFGRGRYSPHQRPSGRLGGMWNRSPERGRDIKGPSFFRSVLEDSGTVDNMASDGLPGGMDPSVTRRPFRSRSPLNREANVFRARLGLRPTGEMGHDRFVNVGRGRGRGRYGEDAPRGRYHGPAGDECDEFVAEYSSHSHPFPRRRRCFSPIERRTNNNSSYQHHHQSGSRSPSRPRTRSPNTGFRRRSRSPNFRPDTRIRPGYRDHGPEYKRSNNSPPPSSRWVSYKERDRPVFDRRSPPPGERFNFYDSSRKPKQTEYYRSGHPGRFSDMNEGGRGRPVDRPSNGYRRGGFVKRHIDGPAKRFYYDDEDGFGRGFDARDRHALEVHARSNPNIDPKDELKPCSNGTDSRFRDFPRRVREDGDLKKRGKELKEESGDDFERKGKEMKDESVTSTTNIDSMMPNEGKEGDNNNKPILGSN